MKSQLRALVIVAGVLCSSIAFAKMDAPAVAASAAASATTTSVAKTPAVKKDAASAAKTTAAPGGGDGKVWVNTKSKAYHCEGTEFYGKTKVGEYMTEADAKAKGNRGKACSKK